MVRSVDEESTAPRWRVRRNVEPGLVTVSHSELLVLKGLAQDCDARLVRFAAPSWSSVRLVPRGLSWRDPTQLSFLTLHTLYSTSMGRRKNVPGKQGTSAEELNAFFSSPPVPTPPKSIHTGREGRVQDVAVPLQCEFSQLTHGLRS